MLSLTLVVATGDTNHTHDTAAADNFTLGADLFNGAANFHNLFLLVDSVGLPYL